MTAAAANGGSNSNKYIANKKEETGIKPANNIKNDCAYQQSERERERYRHRVQPPFSLFLSPSAFLPRFLNSFTINSDTSTFCHPVALARIPSTRCPCPFVPLLSRTIQYANDDDDDDAVQRMARLTRSPTRRTKPPSPSSRM